MYTSFATLGLLLAFGGDAAPAWQTNYSAALEAGQRQNRPVAVFVGAGPAGRASLVAETQRLLATRYVCVYLDRGLAANQRLVRDLGITATGLVISDRTGSVQAFHHDGTLAESELSQQLRRFANPNLVVETTISNRSTRTSFYNGGGAAGGATGPTFRTVNC
ncbi:MAG: hypothetical protein L0Y71_05350 [Gemmataceae bacterium]|nr:hypothetical protein [Gemmataceae bacterium]